MRSLTRTLPSRRVLATGRPLSIADRSVRGPDVESYTAQQQHLGRPLSPHVTVYRQPLSAIASITNRVSGVALSLGLAAGSAVAAGGGEVSALIWTTLHAAPGATPIAKFLIAFPFTYHWMSAARHQFWNSHPEHINLEFAPRTSAMIFAAALALSGVASAVTLEGPVRVPPPLT